jgi:spermidine synthase
MGDVRRNRDRRPICYYYDLVLWLSRFYPRLLGELRELPLQIGTLVVLAGMIGLARWRRGLAVPLAVAAVGLAEMALEVVILFAFQIGHGTLYGRVSLVVTVFMAGLVAGALAGRRLTQWAHQVLLGIVGGVAALGALLTALPVSASVLAYVLLALAAGGFAGAAFPLALTLVSVEESQAAGLLYAADLAGGCLGALVTAALFVPLLGLDQTAVLITLVGVAGMVMLI